MSSNFPEDILVEILKRLPVKSICRFTVVSKVWLALITSPHFISTHLQHIMSNLANDQRSKEGMSLLFGAKENCTLICDGIEKLKFSFDGYGSVVGTSNGLVCLADVGKVILFNLSIRRSFMLPQLSITNRYVVHGFGSDSRDGEEVKVVMLVYPNINIPQFCRGKPYAPEVEVYSLKRHTWKRLVQPGVSCLIWPFHMLPVLMNGRVHWIATQLQGSFLKVLILVFDVTDELFTEILLPDELCIADRLDLCCNLVEKYLTVIKYDKEIDGKSCSIWLMKEYGVVGSWTQTYRFDLVEGMKKVVGVMGDGEVLVTMGEYEVVSYDIKTSTVEKIGICGSSVWKLVDRYVESLVLFGEKEQESSSVKKI